MSQDERSIFGLDNVRLELPIASAGSRSLAAAFDYFLLMVVVFLVTVSFFVVLALTIDGTPRAATVGWIAGGYMLFLLLLEMGYFAGQEILMDGQTVGKRLVRVRVVNLRGGKAEPLALLARNLLRIVDLMIGMPLMLLDAKSRRFGDRIAGTIVVHEPRRDPAVAVGRLPHGWGAREVEVVEALIDRIETLSPEQASAFARRINALAERDEPAFFAGVADNLDPTTRLMVAFGREAAASGIPRAATEGPHGATP